MIRLGHILSAGCLVAAGCMPSDDGGDSGNNMGGQTVMTMTPATAPPAANGGGMNGAAMNPPSGGAAVPAPGDGTPDDGAMFTIPASLQQPFDGADPGNDPNCSSNTLSSIRGWIAGEDGQPLKDAKAQVCIKQGDMTQCLNPVDSGEDGTFVLQLGEFSCLSAAAMRVILPRSTRTAMYCEIPMDKRDGTRLTMLDPLLLFPTQPPADLPDEGDGLTEKTIKFADGFELDLIPLNGPGYSNLGSTSIPGSTKGLCFLEGQKAPARLYGFSPDGGIYEGGSNFRIPNTDDLPMNSQVDLHVLGGLGCTDANGDSLKEGEWYKMGTGTVTADGIVPDNGLKLTCLTWLGVTPQD